MYEPGNFYRANGSDAPLIKPRKILKTIQRMAEIKPPRLETWPCALETPPGPQNASFCAHQKKSKSAFLAFRPFWPALVLKIGLPGRNQYRRTGGQPQGRPGRPPGAEFRPKRPIFSITGNYQLPEKRSAPSFTTSRTEPASSDFNGRHKLWNKNLVAKMQD